MTKRKKETRAERMRREEEARREQAERERRQRLGRLAAAGVFVAVIVVVVLIVAGGSGEEDGGTVSQSSGEEAASLVDGLDQSGSVLGDPDAPVTITEFADLQCPVCAEFAENQIPELIDEVVRPGDANLEFKNWVILGPDSELAAEAALAAGEQDRLWQFVEVFYADQGIESSGYVTDEFLTDVAEAAGLDVDEWDSAREDTGLADAIAAVDAEAIELGFEGTPSVVVRGPGGEEVLGTPESADQVIDAVRKVSAD
jgi:protein-disulfide isomerase